MLVLIGITVSFAAIPADCETSTVSYWTFDAGDGTDDYDGNNATINGANLVNGSVG